MKLYKLLLISVFPLLSACFQVQLVGNVGESTLRVSELRDPAVEIGGMVESWGPDAWIEVTGEQAWAEYGPTLQLALLGMAINSRDGVDAETLYLAQATAGNDYDPTGSLRLSTPAVVQGSWHAIVPGEQLQRGNLKVSALTEAAYQVVREDLDILSDEEILARLNAVAQLLLDDVDDDETVDYKDLLLWSRGRDAASYRGDLAELDALAAAVSAGQPAAMLTSQARTVLGSHRVVMDTNFGTIEMETLNFDAPITVVNFLAYVNANFYDNIIFHRTINNFVIQAGLWELVSSNRVNAKEPNDPILNESHNGISNARGTVAMARTPDPHSARSQFYINQAANANLDYDFESDDWGYAVFARVTRGLDVVDAIAALPTSAIPNIGRSVPNNNVVIRSMTVSD